MSRTIWRPILVIALILVVLISLPASLAAQNSPQLVFQQYKDKKWDLYSISNGDTPARLTEGSGSNQLPCWSPDGRRIAFVSDRDGNKEIYVMNADGSGQTRLTANPGEDTDPAWSPDGSRIAFVSRCAGEKDGIYLMRPDGSERTRLNAVDQGAFNPVWSPDGSRIAFIRGRLLPIFGATWLVVIGSDGGNQRKVDQARGVPSWSPDGERLVYIDMYEDIPADGSWAASTPAAKSGKYENKILIKSADGRGWARIFSTELEQKWVRWSPDGSRLCYVSDSAILIKPAEGRGKVVKIGSLALANFGVFGLLDSEALNQYFDPSWAPDGDRIAYIEAWAERVFGKYRVSVCVANADGSEQRRLYTETGVAMRNPVWAPK